MIRPALTKAHLSMLCAALLLLPAATAGAQQALVPARPAAPDWFESNRTLQILRAQQQPALRPGGQGGLAGAEAAQIYRNYTQQIGRPIQGGSGASGYGPSGGFGANGLSSGYRPPQ
ncbi:hypothetical protein QFZ27_006006 [Inquilinus ginsengisoli]|uniref:hypothetical protein n=1 Tax=Inquilinus ginsengisoli TaxID=363840 RepID=UPI003D22DDD9